MLEVDGEVTIDGTFVDTITLAPADAEDFVGAECEIAGWGQTDGEWCEVYLVRCERQLVSGERVITTGSSVPLCTDDLSIGSCICSS